MAQLLRLAQESPQAPPQPAAKAVGGEELRIPAPEGVIQALSEEEMDHLRALAIAIAKASDPQALGHEGNFRYTLCVARRQDQPGLIVSDRPFDATGNQRWRGGPTRTLLFTTALNADASQTIEEIGLYEGDWPDFVVLPDGSIRYKNPGQLRPEAQKVLAGHREFWRQVPPSSVTRESIQESRKVFAREEALRDLAEARKQTLAVLRREHLYGAEQYAREAGDAELLREIQEEQRKLPRQGGR